MSKVIVYGNMNLNIIDGSSVWLASICETLSTIFDEVHLVSHALLENTRLTERLEDRRNVIIHQPRGSEVDGFVFSISQAADEIGRLNDDLAVDAIFARGFEVCRELAKRPKLANKLYAYITDLPYPTTKISQTNKNRLSQIATNARAMFAQTEATRAYLESVAPEAAGKTFLMNPMIPQGAFQESAPGGDGGDFTTLKIVYAGKLAKDWRVEEMLELPKQLAAIGIDAELTVIGDKFQRAPGDAQFPFRFKAKLAEAHEDPNTPVRWLQGLPRTEVFDHLKHSHIGYSLRSAALDSSTEISTKMLEYGAAGAVPLINHTSDHVALYGKNYPFTFASEATMADVAKQIKDSLPKLTEARMVAHAVSQRYSMDASRTRLLSVLERTFAIRDAMHLRATRPTRLGVVSHDFKFMGELLRAFSADPQIDLQVDTWQSLREHNSQISRRIAKWADVIFCEWAGPSLRFFTENKPVHGRLVTRLHGFELRGDWLPRIDLSKVDCFVFVSEFYRQKAIDQLGIQRDQTMLVANVIDIADFDRPKLSDAQYRLGHVGLVGFGKRPDRSLDVLEKVLEHDDRYMLHFKGQHPWNYPYEWNDRVQKQLYLDFYRRIAASPLLQQHVVFEPFSADIANWLRKIGYILSPSAHETFHLACAEGMASRAVPLVWERAGSREIFSDTFVIDSTTAAAQRVLELNQSGAYQSFANQARDYAQRWDYLRWYDHWREALNIGVLPEDQE